MSKGREKGIEKKKPYVEPELVKHEDKLDEVTMGNFNGSPPVGAN